MSPLITKSARSDRRFDKEFYGDKIAQKLNGAMPSPGVLRVRILIERLKAFFEKSAQLESFCLERKLMRSTRSMFDDSPFSNYERSDPDVSALAEEINSLANELSGLLARYIWRPDVELNSDGTIRQVLRWPNFNEDIAWENSTIHWLISQLPTSPQQKGPFAHFTHCERCGDWFYTGRDGARFAVQLAESCPMLRQTRARQQGRSICETSGRRKASESGKGPNPIQRLLQGDLRMPRC